jgi:hypothetical protein
MFIHQLILTLCEVNLQSLKTFDLNQLLFIYPNQKSDLHHY